MTTKTQRVLEIQNRVRSALARSAIHELHHVRVEQHTDGLLISGVVSSYFHKQMAQDTARLMAREIKISSSIEVR